MEPWHLLSVCYCDMKVRRIDVAAPLVIRISTLPITKRFLPCIPLDEKHSMKAKFWMLKEEGY
jgi:hypothetical protein